MADTMHPIPFEELLTRISAEYRQCTTIFGIHENHFCQPDGKHGITVFGKYCATPLGPAAGPHTQLAQNIVASYLTGGRFIELKTVQKLDDLVIEKPCIDARDECYNIEWSSEHTLQQSYNEYVKAWIALHLLESLFQKGCGKTPSFLFNMSVGYDLEGIKTQKMQRFIDAMIDASHADFFAECILTLETILAEGVLLKGTRWEGLEKRIAKLPHTISPRISSSVTISTMHGCPPHEIEAICTYMLVEKKIDTFVKLNPTLLGYETVRMILDNLGYEYVALKEESFEHDLQYPEAVAMLSRLRDTAEKAGRGFGVKLTNTLCTVNDQGVLNADDMYLSGRTLFPLSIAIGALLAREFEGQLPISYSGGANAITVRDIFSTGIRPITMATEMLKPGGYTRMKQMVEILQQSDEGWGLATIDPNKLEALAVSARTSKFVHKSFRGTDVANVSGKLPLTDCYIAPCVEACPIHQQVPDYIHLVGEGRYDEALEVIYQDNALPHLTGYICDHQCQYHCTRLDYEGAVQIREMKKIAATHGMKAYVNRQEKPKKKDEKAAVIGAGPAGLSAAYFLARAGYAVTVFEKEERVGGIPASVIPVFRFPASALAADAELIETMGVEFRFSTQNDEVRIDTLQKQGYSYLFYAIGAPKDKELPFGKDNRRVIPSLTFLRSYRQGSLDYSLGAKVVVVGGGNTAMDSARCALRVPGVSEVTVIYRRSAQEMPADREEYEHAVQEGVRFLFLAQPESYSEDGTLTCRRMVLGELDESKRRRAVPSGETFFVHADSLISAIGEEVDREALSFFGIPLHADGNPVADKKTGATGIHGVFLLGDALSGPSSVVRCIASARNAVEAAIGMNPPLLEDDGCAADAQDQWDEEELKQLEEQEDEFFCEIGEKKARIILSVSSDDEEAFAKTEAIRCVECSYLCNKCVDVCPNRANVAIDMRSHSELFNNPFQIVHLDAFCNECGNCATFCPWEGEPYHDKLTLFSRMDDFVHAKMSGFIVEEGMVTLRLDKTITEHPIGADGTLDPSLPAAVRAIIEEIIANHPYMLGPVEA